MEQEQIVKHISLPRYRSHKVVEAARIVHVTRDADGHATLILDAGDGRDQFTLFVSRAYIEKHAPQPGGYYVRYADGYESWSPAEAFGQGYVAAGSTAAPVALPALRMLDGHKVNPANNLLAVEVLDQPGAGGASHLYRIRGFDSAKNPSDPWTALHGAPASESHVLFQNGPIAEVGVNGVTHEALLAILVDRLTGFQSGPYACAENEAALRYLVAAQSCLAARTRRRVEAGTEGTHQGA